MVGNSFFELNEIKRMKKHFGLNEKILYMDAESVTMY